MKKLIVSILFSALQFISYGQTDSLTVPFIAYWWTGDTYDYEVTKIRYVWKNSTLTNQDSSVFNARFEVVDSTENNYKIKWTYKTDLQHTYNLPQEALDDFKKYEITEVVYNTNELGEFIGIENWEEISKIMTELLKKVVDITVKNTNSDTINSSVNIQPLLSLYQSKEAIEQLVFKELMLLHFPFGMAISPDKVLTYEESFPNMLGGDPIRGDGKLFIDSVDYEKFECSLFQKVSLNPDDAKKIVLQFLRNLGAPDEELKKSIEKSVFDIQDNNRYHYYYDPGIPIEIETERTMIIGLDNENQKRIDKVKIKLIN